MDERERFEKLREDSLEQYTSRSTIMRFRDAEVRVRADFRAGFHAGWQAHAESVGPRVCSECKAAVAYIAKEGVWRHANKPYEDQSFLCSKYGHPVKPETESLSGDGATGVCDTKDWPHLTSDGTGRQRLHEKRESCTNWRLQ